MIGVEKAQTKDQHAHFDCEDDFSALIEEFKAKLEARKLTRKHLLKECCKSMTNAGDIEIRKIPKHYRTMLIQDYFGLFNEEAEEKSSEKNYYNKSETPNFMPSYIVNGGHEGGTSNSRVLRSAKSSNSLNSSVKSVSSNKSVKRTKSQKKTTAKKMLKTEKLDKALVVMHNKTPIIALRDCANDIKAESEETEIATNRIIKSRVAKTDYYECTLTAANQPPFIYVVKNKPAVILPNMRLITVDEMETVKMDENTRNYLESVRSYLNIILK